MREQVKEVRMQPSSMALRSRVVTADEHREGSMRRLAKTFRVSLRGVRDLITRDRATGSLAPKPPGGGDPAKVAQRGLEVVQGLVQMAPDATLRELRQRVHEASQVSISVATLSRAWARLPLNREKTVSRHGARARRGPKATGRLPRSEPDQCPQSAGVGR
jgi:transposase